MCQSAGQGQRCSPRALSRDALPHVTTSDLSVSATVSASWTASGAWWTATARLTWTSPTAPCRRSASEASSAPRAPTQTAWGWWVGGTSVRLQLYFKCSVHFNMRCVSLRVTVAFKNFSAVLVFQWNVSKFNCFGIFIDFFWLFFLFFRACGAALFKRLHREAYLALCFQRPAENVQILPPCCSWCYIGSSWMILKEAMH